MLVCVSGTKGAPGTTTVAFGLARSLGAYGHTIYVEADPQGGSTAARLGLVPQPGLTTLAASGRHSISSGLLDRNSQPVSETLALLLAPSAPNQARGALRAVGERLAPALSNHGAEVVVDLGRLEKESPALAIAETADRVIFLTHPSLDGVDALFVRLAELPELHDRTAVMTVGEVPQKTYEAEEISGVLGISLARRLPFDPAGASAIWSVKEIGRLRGRGLVLALADAAKALKVPSTEANGSAVFDEIGHTPEPTPTELAR
jgi:MinD-like ATPase involved in chromosome partitioning or flagellar assembly